MGLRPTPLRDLGGLGSLHRFPDPLAVTGPTSKGRERMNDMREGQEKGGEGTYF